MKTCAPPPLPPFIFPLFALLLTCLSCGGQSQTDSATGGNGSFPSGGTGGTGGSSSGATGGTSGTITFGARYEGGQFHLGPVDFDETEWHNACAPETKYATPVRQAEGVLLAGLWNGLPDVAGACDTCIAVTTAAGKSALLRVVTYGDTSRNSIDVSPQAYALLDSGEYPRAMTWQFARCNDSGHVMYEFKTGSNAWWTSLWVRNARVPLAKIEVKSANHPSFITLTRDSDGALTDPSGFGEGPFTVRLTSLDGQTLSDSFTWTPPGLAGQLLTGQSNFP